MDEMEIEDEAYSNRNLSMEGLITQVDFQTKKHRYRCLTVCLGLLVAVLLAGNIGQIIRYEKKRLSLSADPTQASDDTHVDRLQGNYEALTAEKKHFEARLSNLSEENKQLQQCFSSLTKERDPFGDRLDNMNKESDQLQASYNTSKRDCNQLQTSYSHMRRNLSILQTNYDNLIGKNHQLRMNYSNLLRENDELHNSFRYQQTIYSSLQRQMVDLNKRHKLLNISKDILSTSYNSLWRDKESLQTSYKNLQREKQLLQSNYSNLMTHADQMQKNIDTIRRRQVCNGVWKKFGISCYFVSSAKKNWTSGRGDCLDMGADLVVIESREEQVFLNGLLNSGLNAWIGLTDSVEEGIWMWVDGTPLTTMFWQAGQPNSYIGRQDCGELVHVSSEIGEWNDDGCFAEQIWICEKH